MKRAVLSRDNGDIHIDCYSISYRTSTIVLSAKQFAEAKERLQAQGIQGEAQSRQRTEVRVVWLGMKGSEPEPEPEPVRMAYLSEALEHRVYFGPFPTAAEEVDHLLRDLAVTHVINLRPTTTETTAKGLPRDSWYTCFWKPNRNGKARFPHEPELVRLPLPKRDTKRRDLVAWYVREASRLATPPAGEPPTHRPVFYVHNETGFDEEAIFAFTLAQLLCGAAPPLDVDDWIRARPNAQGVLLAEEARALARECVEAAAAESGRKATAGTTKSLLGWVTVRKRDKSGAQ